MGYSTNRPIIQIDNKELSSQMAENGKQLPNFKRVQIEKSGETHEGNAIYTSFFSSLNIKGKETHVGRAGLAHVDDSGAFFVAYIRQESGEFIRKKIEGIDYSIGDFRDPQIFASTTGDVIIANAVKLLSGSYENYWHVLDENLNNTNTLQIPGMNGYFSWGNVITSVENNYLQAAYAPVGNGVSLFCGNINSTNQVEMTNIFDIFPNTGDNPTECTIGYWGKKIVAITRQNTGNMLYRETRDLTGRTGWDEIIDLGFIADAPCILPFTDKKDPLILSASYEEQGYQRSPILRKIYNPKRAIFSPFVFLDVLNGTGGYNSLVENRYGFGCFYYEDNGGATNVYYKELDIDSIGKYVDIDNIVNPNPSDYWFPDPQIFSNITSTGELSNSAFSINDRLVTCQFEMKNFIVADVGLVEFVFTLPRSRNGGVVTGSIACNNPSRDSSSYVSYYSYTDDIKVIGAIDITQITSNMIFTVSATYLI